MTTNTIPTITKETFVDHTAPLIAEKFQAKGEFCHWETDWDGEVAKIELYVDSCKDMNMWHGYEPVFAGLDQDYIDGMFWVYSTRIVVEDMGWPGYKGDSVVRGIFIDSAFYDWVNDTFLSKDNEIFMGVCRELAAQMYEEGPAEQIPSLPEMDDLIDEDLCVDRTSAAPADTTPCLTVGEQIIALCRSLATKTYI